MSNEIVEKLRENTLKKEFSATHTNDKLQNDEIYL